MTRPDEPRAEDYDQVLEAAASWLAGGQRVAQATVIETWGSAPRPAGSLLAVDQDGRMIGSVSGGCIEGAVVSEAMACIDDGEPRRLEFGVSNERAWEVGLACGGTIRIWLEVVR